VTWHDVGMQPWEAALGSAAFFVVAPGMVVGVIPWWITGWRVQLSWAPPVRFVGLVLLVAGVAVLLKAFGCVWLSHVFVGQKRSKGPLSASPPIGHSSWSS